MSENTQELPTNANLDDVRNAVETDPSWSLCPFSREERRTYMHNTATIFKFLERTALRVEIPAAGYAGPATVNRMRLAAIEAINAARHA